MKTLHTTAAIVRTATWFALLLWLGLLVAGWTLSKPESAIHQCTSAAQVAALAVVGYAAARAVTEMSNQLESVAVVWANSKTETDI